MSADLRAAYTAKIKQEAADMSKVQALQKVFQTGPEPVHLKTAFDKKYMRFIMPVTYVAIAGSMSMMIYMALGKMKRSK